jgi:hypothetical protein
VHEYYEDVALQRKEAHDENLRGEPRRFEVGDLVMVLDKTENKTKFDLRWRGPFLVIDRRGAMARLSRGFTIYVPVLPIDENNPPTYVYFYLGISLNDSLRKPFTIQSWWRVGCSVWCIFRLSSGV